MVADGKDLTRVAYLIAAYRHYLKYQVDDNGSKFEIDEPWLTDEDRALLADDDPIAALHLSPFQSTDLSKSEAFVSLYLKFVDAIKKDGAMKVLERII